MSVEKNLKSRNMMKFFIVMAMLLGSSIVSAEDKQIASPDGKLVVTVADMDGRPSYSVSYDNVLFLKPSPLGIIAKVYKKTDFLRPVNKKVKTATIFVVKTRS